MTGTVSLRGLRSRNIIRTIAVRGLALLAAFMLSTVVARSLDTSDAGTFFLLYALLALFATFGRFGGDNLALRLLGGDTQTPKNDIRSIFLIAAFFGIFFAIVSVPFVIGIGELENKASAIMVGSCVIPQSLSGISGTVLRGLGKLGRGVVAELGSMPLIAVLFLMGSELFSPEGATLSSALVALAVGSWATVLWAFPSALVAVKRTLVADEPNHDTVIRFLRKHLHQLLPMMGTSALVYGVVWAPAFVLSIVSTKSEVAFYSVAVRLANMVALIPSIQISYLAPEFARRYYSGDLLGLNSLASKSTFRVAIATIGPVATLVVLAPEALQILFGQEYRSATSVTIILTISAFIVLISGQVNQLMLLCGLERRAMGFTLASLCVWLTAGILLSTSLGAVGAAWVTSVTSIAYAIAASASLRQVKGICSHLTIGRFGLRGG